MAVSRLAEVARAAGMRMAHASSQVLWPKASWGCTTTLAGSA